MKIIHTTNEETACNDRQILVRSLLSTSYLLKRQQENILERYGLTVAKYNILQVLASHAPEVLSQNQIRAKITDKTIDLPRIAKQMDMNCLIIRGREKGNKRVSEITITLKGQELLNEIEQSMDTMNLAILPLSEEEVLQLTAMLQKLTVAMAEAQQDEESEEEVLDGTDGAILETQL
ncbi:MAG: hypothetical protein V4615_11710 [Bacteroidota bacterium]